MRRLGYLFCIMLQCVFAHAINLDFGFFRTYSLPVTLVEHIPDQKYQLTDMRLEMEQLGPVAEYGVPTALIWAFTMGTAPWLGGGAGIVLNRYMHGVNENHARHPVLIGPDGIRRELSEVAKGLSESQNALLRAALLRGVVVGNPEKTETEKVERVIIELPEGKDPRLGFRIRNREEFLGEDQVRPATFTETCREQYERFKKFKR